jgi:hypothetical protein
MLAGGRCFGSMLVSIEVAYLEGKFAEDTLQSRVPFRARARVCKEGGLVGLEIEAMVVVVAGLDEGRSERLLESPKFVS